MVLTLSSGLSALRTIHGSNEFDITVATQTPQLNFVEEGLPFRIIRLPRALDLYRLIKEADVIHVAGAAISPIVMGILARKPVVVEHHGFQTICPTGQLFQEPANQPCPGHFMARRYLNCLGCSSTPQRFTLMRLWALTFFRRFLCRRVALNITPTVWLAARLGLPHSETVPHGLPSMPPPVRPPDVLGPPKVVFLGRLVTTKGVWLLLDASRLLKDQCRVFQVFIVGDGPERTALESHARSLGLMGQVQFLGKLAQPQVEELMNSANIVVVPSLAGEVFGMVVAESMLRELPVIASDNGAFVEVLGDTGKAFNAGNAADLALRLAQLLDDPGQARQLGKAARRRVIEFFSLAGMINGHANIYRRYTRAKDD